MYELHLLNMVHFLSNIRLHFIRPWFLPVVKEKVQVLSMAGFCPVASLMGWTAPGDTRLNFLWLNLLRTLDKRRGKMSGEETTAKKSSLSRGDE